MTNREEEPTGDEPTEVDPRTTGYVAFLDLLGFTHLVSRNRFATTWAAVITVVQEAVALAESPALEYAIASDSIILTTGDEPEDLRRLLVAVGRISFQSLIDHQIALRGGVAFGQYVRVPDDAGGIMCGGPAVVAAYRVEQDQNWVGVMLSPGVLEQIPELQFWVDFNVFFNKAEAGLWSRDAHWEWLAVVAPWHRIPVKSSLEQSMWGYVVLPRLGGIIAPHPEPALEELDQYKNVLAMLTPLAPNVPAQQKYVESRMFVGEIHDNLFNATHVKWWVESLHQP